MQFCEIMVDKLPDAIVICKKWAISSWSSEHMHSAIQGNHLKKSFSVIDYLLGFPPL